MDEFDLDNEVLYIPVKIPKKKYTLGITGLYDTEAVVIVIAMIISLILSYIHYGDFVKYAFFIIPIAAATGIGTFFLLIRTEETNTSTIGYFIKFVKYIRSTKLYKYKYINRLKGDKL